ncbi:MAG: hypothetical protein H0T42_13645 [Deltaproteobacteria bacterium]|nr:hypothetical protein [Deltaproteobacteria bacterium]
MMVASASPLARVGELGSWDEPDEPEPAGASEWRSSLALMSHDASIKLVIERVAAGTAPSVVRSRRHGRAVKLVPIGSMVLLEHAYGLAVSATF